MRIKLKKRASRAKTVGVLLFVAGASAHAAEPLVPCQAASRRSGAAARKMKPAETSREPGRWAPCRCQSLNR